MASIAFHDPRLSSVSGGGEAVTLQLISFLLGAGHDVSAVTRKATRSPLFEEALRRESRLACIEIEGCDGRVEGLPADGGFARSVWDCDRLAPQSLSFNLATREFYDHNPFDLVVVSFIPDLALLPTKDRVLLNIFGLPPDQETARVERPLLDRCFRMTFASSYTKRKFVELFGLEPARDPGPVAYATVQRVFFERPSGRAKRFDACFVGRLIKRKGVYPILDAIARLAGKGRRTTLAMVGGGGEREGLAAHAGQLGISDQIAWIGTVNASEAARVIDESRCFLYPVVQPEAFACGNIEAMARGTPVITTNLGGSSDYVRPGENALVCRPDCPESLASAIERVLDHPELSERLRDGGMKAAEPFRPDQGASRWLTLFLEALSAPC